MGKPYGQDFASRRIHGAGRGRAKDGATKPVDDHQSVVIGQNFGREIFGNCKIKDIAKFQISQPFFVGTKIGNTGFNFENDKFSFSIQARNISPAIVFQRKFHKRCIPQFPSSRLAPRANMRASFGTAGF